nr:MAG TPA: hypothetical protein [Caudoviricetes sp.]
MVQARIDCIHKKGPIKEKLAISIYESCVYCGS